MSIYLFNYFRLFRFDSSSRPRMALKGKIPEDFRNGKLFRDTGTGGSRRDFSKRLIAHSFRECTIVRAEVLSVRFIGIFRSATYDRQSLVKIPTFLLIRPS